MATCRCEKCGKLMDEAQFYTYRDGNKTEMCKKCLTMHIDPFNDETYVWLLKKMDVPYIPVEWNALRDKAIQKDPTKVNGGAIFGKYLSKMKLNQWKNYRWADTETLQEEARSAAEEKQAEMAQRGEYLKEQFAVGAISEAEYKTLASATQLKEDYYERAAQLAGNGMTQGGNNAFDETKFFDEKLLPDPANELTNEDKVSLAIKWGTYYTPQEWVSLEKMYREMEESFDIQDADSRATLILLCKTSLKANQAIDGGDYDGYQKLSKVASDLRKTAKFTAAQNKNKEKDAFDSIGEIVLLCEKEGGFIPRFAPDAPQDIVDTVLKDYQNYVYKLVTEDLGLGQQIEDAIKKFEVQKTMIEAEAAKNNTNIEDDFSLTDEELSEMYEDIENQKDLDAELIRAESENDV